MGLRSSLPDRLLRQKSYCFWHAWGISQCVLALAHQFQNPASDQAFVRYKMERHAFSNSFELSNYGSIPVGCLPSGTGRSLHGFGNEKPMAWMRLRHA